MARWNNVSPLWDVVQRRGTPLWYQLQTLHSEMNRLFDRFGNDANQPFGFSAAYPAVDIWDDSETVFIEAELPGVQQNELEVHVTGGNQVTLKGERKAVTPAKGVWHRQERGVGAFNRTITLPFAVDADKVEARFENGVLLIKLPKAEAARPRKITVRAE